MHPPTTVSHRVARQGPFLLQPSPRTLEGGEGGDATDIVYLAFGADEDDEGEGETERLGVVLVVYQDGKVDVCLDVEKVEARWDSKSVCHHWKKLCCDIDVWDDRTPAVIYRCLRFMRP